MKAEGFIRELGMTKIIFSLLVLGAVMSSSALRAHHSFSATFQADAKITIEGVVTNFSFKNPHILVYTEVSNDDGTTTEWVSEGSAATLVRRVGWTKDTLKPGDRIRVTGDSTHDGSPMTSLDLIEVLSADGSVLAQLNPEEHRQVAATVNTDGMALTLEDGRPNLTGYWTGHGMGGGGPPGEGSAGIPLSEIGQRLQDQFDIANDAQVFCDPPGLVRQVGTPHPIKITQHDDRVVFEYEEYAGFREVYFDARNAKGIKTHLGDSIAYYEGDTLVVETINLLANQSNPGGGVFSDQSTTKEIYRRTDNEQYGPIVSLDIQVTDPINLTELYIRSDSKMSAGEDYEFIENDCQIPLRDRGAVNPAMSFFITSEGRGNGANLGGLEGADAHCNALAETVGQGDKSWAAYLSITGENPVNARDRIGAGPWYNAKGEPIAQDIDDLHSEATWLTKASAVSERGKIVSGRGDEVNRHDILTGSLLDGTASTADEDTTCSNWTSNGEGSALVGHHDRQGGGQNPESWNQAHGSRGCGQEDLQGTGGDGLYYCFATDVASAPSAQVLAAPSTASVFGASVSTSGDVDDNSSRVSFLVGFGLAMVCLVGVLILYRKTT